MLPSNLSSILGALQPCITEETWPGATQGGSGQKRKGPRSNRFGRVSVSMLIFWAKVHAMDCRLETFRKLCIPSSQCVKVSLSTSQLCRWSHGKSRKWNQPSRNHMNKDEHTITEQKPLTSAPMYLAAWRCSKFLICWYVALCVSAAY